MANDESREMKLEEYISKGLIRGSNNVVTGDVIPLNENTQVNDATVLGGVECFEVVPGRVNGYLDLVNLYLQVLRYDSRVSSNAPPSCSQITGFFRGYLNVNNIQDVNRLPQEIELVKKLYFNGESIVVVRGLLGRMDVFIEDLRRFNFDLQGDVNNVQPVQVKTVKLVWIDKKLSYTEVRNPAARLIIPKAFAIDRVLPLLTPDEKLKVEKDKIVVSVYNDRLQKVDSVWFKRATSESYTLSSSWPQLCTANGLEANMTV